LRRIRRRARTPDRAKALDRADIEALLTRQISTRATRRPELERAVTLARELRAFGVAVTFVVHEHKRLGHGIDLATLAEEPGAAGKLRAHPAPARN
jgi:hypothetical protein